MKILVEIDVSSKKRVAKTRALRSVFGFTDRSNNGKYSYERHGLVSKIPGALRIKSALLIERRYEKRVLQQLKELGVDYKVIRLDKAG
jgi:hypothetical protein